MGAYEYQALDAEGRNCKGMLEADSERQARQRLKDDRLIPLSVTAVNRRSSAAASAGPREWRRVPLSELAIVLRQLSTMLMAGLPLGDVLQTVARQTGSNAMARVLTAVRSRVLEGHALATAMAAYPNVFPGLYVATVEAGEQAGHMGPVLERLADYTEARQQLRQKLQLALIYPAILTLVSLLVVTGLLAYVVPEVVRVFEGTGQTLPALTRGLIATSDHLRTYGQYELLALLLAFLGVRYSLRIESVRRMAHGTLLHLPVVGRLSRAMNGERFTRTFGILLGSGVPVLDAFRIAAKVIPNLPIRESVEQVSAEVREGGAIGNALEKSGHFSPVVVQMISSGEASGRLPDLLDRAAVAQDKEVETLLSTLLGLFEPLLILVMGGIVLVIVLAILMPILELNQLVS